MPPSKTSYTELTHQVVRESREPLPFAEILRRVNTIAPITTKNPKGTIRNAISQSRLIVNTGDGRFGWKYRIINGSVLRLTLSDSDCQRAAIEYPEEVRDALCPAFFANQKYADREPIRLEFPSGPITRLALEHFREARWGTRGSPEFWEWFKSLHAEPGDALIIRVLDGDERLYAVDFQPQTARDEFVIAARNQQIVQAALAHFRRSASGVADWDMSTHLLAIGMYKNPVPPDALKDIWTRDLWEPELAKKPERGGWVYVGRNDSDLMISSLMEQLRGETPFSKKKRTQAPIAETAAPNSIYQLKVTLQDSHPAIWRRIQVADNILLPHLHGVLQLAMGWMNSHLHSFQVGKQTFAEPSPDDYVPVTDYRTVRLNQIAPKVKDRFVYLYDFGDSWEHEIIVEKILPVEKDARYPRCLDGQRACPPEDVGGVWGYADFVKAIRNPRHPEHDEMLEWVGGEFDPEKFDLDGVNGMLKVFQSTLAHHARKKR
ncbi:MAG: hypothetical protein M1570_18095 [Chloroflexi bacterium]|nr:hypothetical protein [Chloroflexota bacterium]